MDNNSLDTVNLIMQYTELGFDSRFDNEFYAALDRVELDKSIKFEDYDLSCTDGAKNLIYFLSFLDELWEKYEALEIPYDIFLDTAKDIVRWTESWSEVKGELYLGELLWLKRHFSMKLFKVGRLQFSKGDAEEDIPEANVKKGDPVLEVHIPSGEKLDTDACLSSIEEGKAFFSRYFPSYEFKCLTCHSWLLDPTLPVYLGETSNIVKFGRLFTPIRNDDSDAILRYIFSWNTDKTNIESREPYNTMTRTVKEAFLNGEKFHETLGYIKI